MVNSGVEEKSIQSKARGMLVGLAVGDALGAPFEFGCTSSDIIGLGDKIAHFQDSPLGPAGTWTDDTSMTLCIADSLLEKGGYDSYDIMNRFYRWMKEGYRTPDGEPAADVGNQTRNALVMYARDPIVKKGTPKTNAAGNGAIMRLAPIIIANLTATNESNIQLVIDMAILSCRETHNSTTAEAITAMFAIMLYYATQNLSKGEIISRCSDQIHNTPQVEGFDDIVEYVSKENGEKLRDLGGYIVDAFTIALWGFMNFDNFKDGMLAVIRLGGDTDTNAAIYGQLAGAYYGYEAIPEEWRRNVHLADELVGLADRLLEMKECPIIRARFEDNRYFKEVK